MIDKRYNAYMKNEDITKQLINKSITISTMESCTSGLLASTITDTEGASAILKGAFITYSNEAKIKQGVPADVIEKYGVYSAETAQAMASACQTAYASKIGIGVTGTTGNVDPANADSVKGEIYYCIRYDNNDYQYMINLNTSGLSRHEIKEKIVNDIMEKLENLIK